MKRDSISQKTRKKSRTKNSDRKSTLRKVPYISSYQVAEGIVKLILDKIINISIHQSDMSRINKEINNYCFEFIQAQIEPLFEESFINYTKIKDDKNTLFWKNKKQPENQWIEIFEPQSVENDRFESSQVNIQEIVKKKETINEIKEGNEHNDITENNERKDSIRKTKRIKEKTLRLNNLKTNVKKEEPIINIENNKENNKENINNVENKTQKNIIEINKNNNQNNRGGKRKVPMIDFPSEDIPGIDNEYKHEKYDPPNIHILRKDIEEEIKNKEKEIKLNNNNNKVKSIKLKEDLDKINKNLKPLDTNKFTFDSNGKIISFKQYKLDNLSKDFTFIRNTIKAKEEKEEVKIKPKKHPRLSIKAQNDVVIIKDNKINDYMTKEDYKAKLAKEKIIPSGSNFKLILPNIGVVVKENNELKEGSKDFNKYFKKYSIKDYDKILNEYVPLQNKTKLKNKLEKLNFTTPNIQKQLSTSEDKINNTNYNTTINNNTQMNVNTISNKKNENMNPLLTSNDNIPINENTSYNLSTSYMKTAGNNSKNKNNILYNPLLTSFNTRSTYINLSKDKKRNDLADSIIMKKMGASSLKMEIDILQDLKTQPNYRKIKSIKKENIFDKNFIRNDKLRYTKSKKDNPFIALNKKILTDVNFGNAIEQKNIVPEKEKVVVSKHLSMQEAIKEIGYTMISGIKIKFPRNRRVELSK